ncbi:MAG TPA: hypothetical protein VKM72_12320 [Thermoanaerobaculia bacterium]|nr:hypothetical protein [Thermoanaerobaculia bacterium]
MGAEVPAHRPVHGELAEGQDLEIRVLNQKKTLQARRFANLTPETHGAKQKRFEDLVSVIEELEKRVEEER